MGQFDRQIQTALKLIKKNGQKVQWLKAGATIADPAKPWLPVGKTPISYTPYICFLPLDKDGREFLTQLGFTEAFTGTYYGLMGQVNFDPDSTDKVIRNGVALEIKNIDLLSPNGQKILYTIIFNG